MPLVHFRSQLESSWKLQPQQQFSTQHSAIIATNIAITTIVAGIVVDTSPSGLWLLLSIPKTRGTNAANMMKLLMLAVLDESPNS